MKWRNSVERLLLVVWVGAILVTGFLVTPVLFEMLESRQLAGNIAGHLFSIVSWIGLLSGPVLLFIYSSLNSRVANWRPWLVVIMLIITTLGEFYILPQMSELKLIANGEFVEGSQLQQQFSRLHIVSSTLFILNAVFGIALVVLGTTRLNASKSQQSY